MNKIKNILICGLGAIGAIYANKFNNYADVDLKILVDKNRLEKYTKHPKIFNGEKLTLDYILPSNTDFKADLIIIATKFGGLNEAVINIKNFIKKDTIMMSLLNGITSEEIIASKYGWEHVLLSYFIGSSAMRDGHKITHNGIGTIVFGSKNNTQNKDIQLVKTLFDNIGIEYKIPEDMLRAYWLKYMLNVSSNQLSAALNLTFGQMQNNQNARYSLKKMMEEVEKLAKVEGEKNTETMIDEAFEVFDTMIPDGKTSMLQDIQAQRMTEVEMFAGTVIELGKKYSIPTPYNLVIKDMIEIIQKNYKN